MTRHWSFSDRFAEAIGIRLGFVPSVPFTGPGVGVEHQTPVPGATATPPPGGRTAPGARTACPAAAGGWTAAPERG